MDILDITHRTNGTFVQTFVLDAWADLYDFSLGHWHAMLRKQVESAIAHYEWSTENGKIEYDETLAHGEITFVSNPVLGTSVTIGSTVVEFGASDGVPIGVNLAATLTNLLTYLNNSDDADIVRCTYTVIAGTILKLTYFTAGSLGNAFPIDTDVAGADTSGDTLTGGGGTLTLRAPVEDIETFFGDYFYDVRFQVPDTNGEVLVPIVGGVITFEKGVTRDTVEAE